MNYDFHQVGRSVSRVYDNRPTALLLTVTVDDVWVLVLWLRRYAWVDSWHLDFGLLSVNSAKITARDGRKIISKSDPNTLYPTHCTFIVHYR